jgi:carboxylesterase
MEYPVLAGAEPFRFDGGDVGVLLLHGFTGSPQGLRPWGEALRDAGVTVHCPLVVGALSFGGALALHLAATRSSQVLGVVTVNPWLYSRDPRLLALPLVKLLVATAPGVGSDLADSETKELAYAHVPLKALASVRTFQRSVRAALPRVTQPLLCFVSRQDHVVLPGNTELVAAQVGSADVHVVWLERSYHVATLDLERQTIFDGSIEFVRRVAGT